MNQTIPSAVALDERPELEPRVPSAGVLPVSRKRALASCLAILALGASVIHFAVAGEHYDEYWLFGLFMLATGWLQLLWAFAAVTRPSRALWWLGGALNLGIIAVYVVTRTVGDVVGPTPTDVEPVGFGDAACTAAEAILVLGCAWLLASRRDRATTRSRFVATCLVVGAAASVILSISLVAGGPEMVMGG